MAEALAGKTRIAVISFIDLYDKVKRNFPEAERVAREDRIALGREIINIASACGMTVRPCAEGDELAPYGADCGGCMTIPDYERAIFVFLPSELEAMQTETEANGTEMTFCGQFGDWQVYTSSKQLMYPITETIDFKPEYN